MLNIDTVTLSVLQQSLHYTFSDITLLHLALKHKSAGKPNNERLEFLGDAILNAVVAEALYLQNDNTPEGKMTTARAMLVKGETLTSIGEQLQIAELMTLGQGERKHGAKVKSSILEDAVEAIIGAVFLDGGFVQSRSVILNLMGDRLNTVVEIGEQKDAKTELQELTQSKHISLPSYELLNEEGPPHNRVFTVGCRTQLLDIQTEGEGSSRRSAEQKAAHAMLVSIAEQMQ